MTAEIAILNKTSIALAADSAVTMSSSLQEDVKIYNSANKLFALSKYHPVGIMIYGNAEFMDIPWEVIIKMYRNKLNDTCFDTLEEYVEDFKKFLTDGFFSEEQQKEYLSEMATWQHNIFSLLNIQFCRNFNHCCLKKSLFWN